MNSLIHITQPLKIAAWSPFLFGILLGSQTAMRAVDDSLALTPPMGWNSWNKFQGNINEAIIRQAADAMAMNVVKEAGYTYTLRNLWSEAGAGTTAKPLQVQVPGRDVVVLRLSK